MFHVINLSVITLEFKKIKDPTENGFCLFLYNNNTEIPTHVYDDINMDMKILRLKLSDNIFLKKDIYKNIKPEYTYTIGSIRRYVLNINDFIDSLILNIHVHKYMPIALYVLARYLVSINNIYTHYRSEKEKIKNKNKWKIIISDNI